MERGQFDVAAKAVAEAGRLLELLKLQTENGCDPKIFGAIRSDFRRKRAKLKADLDELWGKAVVWNAAVDECLTLCTAVPAPRGTAEVNIGVLVDGLRHVEMLDRKLVQFAEQACSVVLEPLVKALGTSVSVARNQRTITLTLAKPSASSSKSKRGGNDAAAVGALYRSAEQLFQLISGAFSDDTSVRAAIGASLWPRFTTAVIERVLANTVSAQRSKQDQHGQIVEASRKFEDTVRGLGFIGDDCQLTKWVKSDANPRTKTSLTPGIELSRYLADITIHTANNRRQELLETARDLLSSDNFNTILVKQETERGGLFLDDDEDDSAGSDAGSAATTAALAESLFRLPTCHVSVSTKALVDYAYDNLAEMAGMEEEEAILVFYGVRDMFDLFRAIVPVKNREMLLQVCRGLYPEMHHAVQRCVVCIVPTEIGVPSSVLIPCRVRPSIRRGARRQIGWECVREDRKLTLPTCRAP